MIQFDDVSFYVETRGALKIEDHWTSNFRPHTLPISHPDYDRHFEQLLEKFPIPDDYHRRNNQNSDSGAIGLETDHQNNIINPKARKPLTFDKETGGRIKNFGTHLRRDFSTLCRYEFDMLPMSTSFLQQQQQQQQVSQQVPQQVQDIVRNRIHVTSSSRHVGVVGGSRLAVAAVSTYINVDEME